MSDEPTILFNGYLQDHKTYLFRNEGKTKYTIKGLNIVNTSDGETITAKISIENNEGNEVPMLDVNLHKGCLLTSFNLYIPLAPSWSIVGLSSQSNKISCLISALED